MVRSLEQWGLRVGSIGCELINIRVVGSWVSDSENCTRIELPSVRGCAIKATVACFGDARRVLTIERRVTEVMQHGECRTITRQFEEGATVVIASVRAGSVQEAIGADNQSALKSPFDIRVVCIAEGVKN